MDDSIWNGILDAGRLGRYYSALADKYRTKHRIVTVLIAVGASGAMASLLTRMPSEVSAVVMLVVAVAAIWSSYADYSGKAAMADAAASQYDDLAVEWRRLWYGEASVDQVTALQHKEVKIASGLPLNEDKALNQKAQIDAYETIPLDFGIQGDQGR